MSRSWRLVPASLFGRALLTLIGTFGLFAGATLFIVIHFALAPVSQRSAADLAGIMVLAARTLVQLPPGLRDDYRERLAQDYALRLADEAPVVAPSAFFFPYVARLEQAMAARLGRPVEVVTSVANGERWFWVALDVDGHTIWTGFPRERLGTRPLEGLSVIAALAVLLVLVSAAILARRVTQPLNRLAAAASEVAAGRSPNPLAETGPAELANLAHQFNEMSQQVRDLLANRTVLLAGISHDLRTPLTRLRLAIAMLPADASPDLIARMERDTDEMNALITQAVDFARNVGTGGRALVDLVELITDLAADQPRVSWPQPPPCHYPVDILALRRILGNLLENALRYSQEQVEIRLDCRLPAPVISLLDRGPGIPESEREAVFRPYYRIEHSRNRATGGSGLGLAVARQLAIANQIELRLGLRRGGGTVASVHLPALEAPDPRTESAMRHS
ncbi:MAG: HAMP domain-containing protein [Lamprocystis purpurea]|jgi:two-component system osmolarity sensor histidine kinase EnvZ|uniref:ATP-binding protein n=1 Tax=Lamprocystis purpurea TaxID=61598 RepID=UPI0003695022|nr:ATP-binding protein [Lamprocystis purpurea]MBV5274321.1 HAMP domain-containing protein [Lamprocystis purpurea]